MKIYNSLFLSENSWKIIVILFSVLFIVMFLVSISESNLAIIILTFLLTIMSLGFIFIIANKETFKGMLIVNSIFILFYMLHMLIIYYLMLDYYNQWHVFLDEIRYFTTSIIDVSKLLNEGSGLFDIMNTFKYSETALYLYVQGYLALLANYFDNVSILTQKLFNVYISALIPTVIFYLLANIITKREAFYAAIIYGFFSFNLAYSYPLLRDGFGTFLFIMIFYYYLLPSSNKNFVFILLFAVLSYFLRPETGMFALLIAATYMYFKFNTLFKNKLFLRFMAVLLLLPLIAFLILKFNSIETMGSLMERSGVRSGAQASSDSLGAALLNLPIVIRLPLKFIHGQITYFPPWSVLANGPVSDIYFARFSEFIASIAWFHVWPFILVGVFKDKIFLILKNEKLVMLFILSVMYIGLSGLVAVNPRQLMYVYPIIFVVATVSFVNMNIKKRKKIISLSLGVYMILISLYLFAKYLR